MGVRRAVEMTLGLVRQTEKGIATFGPLIHNPQVLEMLKDRGVRILSTIPEKNDGTILIRAHGVPPQQKEKLMATGAHVEDATCPRVLKVQAIIRKYGKLGYTTIIIGDCKHAEVEGLMGYAGEKGFVVSSEADIDHLELQGPYIIVSQTTQDQRTFDTLSSVILDKFPEGRVFNTICDSTHKRQASVIELCDQVQAMVVVGGKSSANTKRLGEIVENRGRPVFMVETEDELNFAKLEQYDCVGVTAGASTPSWMINRVVRALESMPGADDSLPKKISFKFISFILASNLLVSIGGACLAYATSLLQAIEPSAVHIYIVFSYLFAMHNLNRFVRGSMEKFRDPFRDMYARKFRLPLLVISTLLLSAALYLSVGIGTGTFLLLLVLSVLGFFYRIPFMPKSLSGGVFGIRRLKEIPGSRTFFVSAAWAVVIVLLPAREIISFSDSDRWAVFFFVLSLVFIRSAFLDVFEIQEDRMLGRETLPVLIGRTKTLRLLYFLAGAVFFMLLVLPAIGAMSHTAYWISPALFYLLGVIVFYEKGLIKQGMKLEISLDFVFILIFLLAVLQTLSIL